MAKFSLGKSKTTDTVENNGATKDAAAKSNKPAKTPFTLKPSKQTCIALGGLMGVVLVSTAGLFTWQKGQIEDLKVQVAEKVGAVKESEQIARELTAVKATYETTRGELRFLETSVAANEYIPSLLQQVETLAKSVNLKVDAVRPGPLEAPAPMPADKEARKTWKPQPYSKQPIELQVRGTYWNVNKLLFRLTKFQKILAVESVRVAPPAAVYGKSPTLTVNINLTGFIFPDAPAPVAAPAATASSGGGAAPNAARNKTAQARPGGTASKPLSLAGPKA